MPAEKSQVLEQSHSGDPMGSSSSEKGEVGVLRRNVMALVISEQYDRAIKELDSFLRKDFDFPEYARRIKRYIHHCVDLVHAIRAKRRFPGMRSLTMAKQQELKDKFEQHFEELQWTMDQIERIHGELKLNDIRSTVIVVRAVVYASLFLALAAFAIELVQGQGLLMWAVLNNMIVDFINWVISW
ncbi:MAG: hypothetical protein WCH11_07750 [Bdellovibrio sp.]